MGVVIITGCSRGIGHHAALELARRGWTVVGTLRGDAGREALEAGGVEVEHLDVTDAARCAAVVDAVRRRHGRLDAVVANAGRGLFGCFEDVDDDEIRALFEVNLYGAMHIVRPALPALRETGGKVVLMSSIAGRRGAPGSGSYNATKFA
ncbi:MAG: SDR family NAD(P)-dependent oxidoreductase, partial [Deltaproteobacteria bacterium]